MTDLYGELLSRALNRGAPQGHFAAYITPQEGGALRAMGGGVAPGGGQFMANGIPSFEYDIGGGLGSMSASDVADAMDMAAAVGYGAGSSGMGRSAEQMEAIAQAVRDVGAEGPLSPSHMAQIQARADRQAQEVALSATANRELSVEPMTEAERQAYNRAYDLETGLIGFETEMEATAAEFGVPTEYGVTPPAVPETTRERAARNIERAINNPNLYNKNTSTWTEAGVAELGKDISSSPFAAGYYSPAATLARNNKNATARQVAEINAHSDRTGGYAVNDPESGVSVPEGMNMGLVPAAMGTLAGLVSPTMGLGMTFSGIPTLGTMALDFARKDTGALGSAARGLQQGISTITNPINTALGIVTEPIDQLGNFLGGRVRAGASAVGNFIDENVVDPLGQYATDITGALPDLPNFSIGDVLSQGETPVGAFQDPQTGGNQEVYVPPQPAPVTEPFVSDDAERQFAEIPPEILARILANEQFGRQRAGLA